MLRSEYWFFRAISISISGFIGVTGLTSTRSGNRIEVALLPGLQTSSKIPQGIISRLSENTHLLFEIYPASLWEQWLHRSCGVGGGRWRIDEEIRHFRSVRFSGCCLLAAVPVLWRNTSPSSVIRYDDEVATKSRRSLLLGLITCWNCHFYYPLTQPLQLGKEMISSPSDKKTVKRHKTYLNPKIKQFIKFHIYIYINVLVQGYSTGDLRATSILWVTSDFCPVHPNIYILGWSLNRTSTFQSCFFIFFFCSIWVKNKWGEIS